MPIVSLPIKVLISYHNQGRITSVSVKNRRDFKYKFCQFLSSKAQQQNNTLGKNNFIPSAFSFRSSHTKSKVLFLQKNKDRNKTGLRRFKPNSRTILFDEQSNPCNQLQLQDIASRHRGDKRKRRYGRLIFIILLSLWYLLSDDQITFHSVYLVR